MQVAHALKELGHLAEIAVRLNLFQIRLGQPRRILPVIRNWPVQYNRPIPLHSLLLDAQAPLLVLREPDRIFPRGRFLICPNSHAEGDCGVSPGCEASERPDTAASPNGLLQTTADRDDVSQETKGIQEIRFAGCVRPDDKHPSGQLNVCLREIPPVFDADVSEAKIPCGPRAHRIGSLTKAYLYHRFAEVKKAHAGVEWLAEVGTAANSVFGQAVPA
jgi:hypothetical protein